MQRYSLFGLITLCCLLVTGSRVSAVIVVPVDANASSSMGEAPDWRVERAAVDHAATFNVATGESGNPANGAGIGLVGYLRVTTTFTPPTIGPDGGMGLIGHVGETWKPVPVSTPAPNNGGTGVGNSMSMTAYPLFWDWRPDSPYSAQYPKHSNMKSRAMWLSATDETRDQWIEIELPRFAELQQIWIWNFNDAPEIGRATASFRLETASADPGPGLVKDKPIGTPSDVTYDVEHGTFTQAESGLIEDRPPDWVIDLTGTQTRYIRLSGIHNFEGAPGANAVGLGPILVFDTTPRQE